MFIQFIKESFTESFCCFTSTESDPNILSHVFAVFLLGKKLKLKPIFKPIKCIFDGTQGKNRYDEQNGLHLRTVVGNLLD